VVRPAPRRPARQARLHQYSAATCRAASRPGTTGSPCLFPAPGGKAGGGGGGGDPPVWIGERSKSLNGVEFGALFRVGSQRPNSRKATTRCGANCKLPSKSCSLSISILLHDSSIPRSTPVVLLMAANARLGRPTLPLHQPGFERACGTKSVGSTKRIGSSEYSVLASTSVGRIGLKSSAVWPVTNPDETNSVPNYLSRSLQP